MSKYDKVWMALIIGLLLCGMALCLVNIFSLLGQMGEAQASGGIYIGEQVSGNVKYCIYDVYGEKVIVTVGRFEQCPWSIEE